VLWVCWLACRLSWWKHCADYFPTQLIKTADLDPDGRYIFVVAPHGRQVPAGAWDVTPFGVSVSMCVAALGSVQTTASQLGTSSSLANWRYILPWLLLQRAQRDSVLSCVSCGLCRYHHLLLLAMF
jgi:hypothetical protein